MTVVTYHQLSVIKRRTLSIEKVNRCVVCCHILAFRVEMALYCFYKISSTTANIKGKNRYLSSFFTIFASMRIVIQRVSQASVTIGGRVKSEIGKGYLILLGIEEADTEEDVDWLVKKIIGLRVFNDENGVMNVDILQAGGDIIVVSQFTLMASYKKGNRPSWIRAAGHATAIPLYETFVERLSKALGKPVGTGEFGADMQVALINDGPVTICMDTKNKE